jgi:hypothetical protein
MNWMPRLDELPRSTIEESRKAAKQAEQERAVRRENELLTQTSPENDPQRRIAIWERLHALSLPRRPDHPLVTVIAGQTGLTVREVCDEQG